MSTWRRLSSRIQYLLGSSHEWGLFCGDAANGSQEGEQSPLISASPYQQGNWRAVSMMPLNAARITARTTAWPGEIRGHTEGSGRTQIALRADSSLPALSN
jgi:hypothetical protein